MLAILKKNSQINIICDHYCIRGLDYYSGIVFEVKKEGTTICGGGEYEINIKGQLTKGSGWAIGINRILDSIQLDKKKFIYIDKKNCQGLLVSLRSKLENLDFTHNINLGTHRIYKNKLYLKNGSIHINRIIK